MKMDIFSLKRLRVVLSNMRNPVLFIMKIHISREIAIVFYVLSYYFPDWYGAYETPLNENDHYKDYLNLDYTFNHPSIHENVSNGIACKHALFLNV